MQDYEPFAEMFDDALSLDLFPPKSFRSDSYYWDVERIALALMEESGAVRTTQVFDKYKAERPEINRQQTVRDNLHLVAKNHGWAKKGYAYYPSNAN